MFLRAFLVISFLLPWCLSIAAQQGPRRINPIHVPRRNPNITEPSLNPPVSDSPVSPADRQPVPVGLVYVHQSVELPQGEAALMTLDGEPLPNTTVRNVTLGMVVSADGLIVARLVGVLPSQPPRDLKIYASGQGRPLTAKFLGMDAVTELCVLKVEGAMLAPVSEASLKFLPEEWRGKMWGFHPQQGQGRNGALSLTRPRIQPFVAQAIKANNDFRYSITNQFYRLTQPTLTLVQDGSVITSADGKVFGVAVCDLANEISLVYSLKRIREIVAKIQESKESLAYGWLGATGRDIPPTIQTRMSTSNTAPMRGVWVDGVFPDSPAEAAGIKVKDVLLSINDRTIETRAQLGSVLRQLPPGSEITIRLKREDEFKVVKAKLVPLAADPQQLLGKLLQRLEAWKSQLKTLPNTDPEHGKLEAKVVAMDAIMKGIIASPAPPEVKLRVFYGVELQTMTEALLQHFAAPHGVLVATVNENSLAARAGLKAGDIITHIGESKITDQAGLLQAIDGAESSIKLTVLRRHVSVTLAFNR